MRFLDRVSAAALAIGLVCPLTVGAQPAPDGLSLQPSPFGVVCAGETTVEGRTWTCDDVEQLTVAYAADSAALGADIPQAVRDAVIQLTANRQAPGGEQ